MCRARGVFIPFSATILIPIAVSAQTFTGSLTISPNPVAAGSEGTIVLTVRNDGSTGPANIILTHPSLVTFVSGSGPSGWTVTNIGFVEFQQMVRLEHAAFAAGASATISVRFHVPAARWPGTTVRVTAAGPFSPFPTANILVAGAAPPPTAASQLFGGSPTSGPFAEIRITDAAYDPAQGVYILAGWRDRAAPSSDAVIAATAGTSGAAIGVPLDLAEVPNAFIVRGPSLAYSASVSNGAVSGGFIVVWAHGSSIHAQPVVTQGLAAAARTTVGEGVSTFAPPRIAYSPVNRSFLVAWESCPTAACRILVRRIGLDGEPAGSTIDVAAGRAPQIVWNPVANEFGLVWVTNSRPGAVNGFARLSVSGTVLSRLDADLAGEIAVNGATGNYIVVRSEPIHAISYLGEIGPTGRLISRGVLAAQAGSGVTLSFNPLSETVLARFGTRMVELNRHGAPLALPVTAPACPGPVAARTDAPEWRVFGFDCTVAIGTLSTNGGSDMRLGGCTTPDPFASLGGGHCYDGGWLPPGLEPPGVPLAVIAAPPPPPPAPPVGCLTSDPFIALGGGTCVGGGWYPPGMIIPAPPSPPPPGCATPDPFVSLGGGTCFNGGWYPPGMPLPGSGG